jgi:hypothetical protein
LWQRSSLKSSNSSLNPDPQQRNAASRQVLRAC